MSLDGAQFPTVTCEGTRGETVDTAWLTRRFSELAPGMPHLGFWLLSRLRGQCPVQRDAFLVLFFSLHLDSIAIEKRKQEHLAYDYS